VHLQRVGECIRRESIYEFANDDSKGRPKGTKNLSTVVLKESKQLVLVNGPRGRRKVTKLEAAMMQIGNKSAQGDLRASREFFALVQQSEESAASGGTTIQFNELDQQMIESIRRRMLDLEHESKKPNSEESK
jgi:hypothetical protein